jgi:hypothetical protein
LRPPASSGEASKHQSGTLGSCPQQQISHFSGESGAGVIVNKCAQIEQRENFKNGSTIANSKCIDQINSSRMAIQGFYAVKCLVSK